MLSSLSRLVQRALRAVAGHYQGTICPALGALLARRSRDFYTRRYRGHTGGVRAFDRLTCFRITAELQRTHRGHNHELETTRMSPVQHALCS
jgi:hypothetical protein